MSTGVDLTDAIEAVAREEWNREHAPHQWDTDVPESDAREARRHARKMLSKAAPMIEDAVREQVAQEIEEYRESMRRAGILNGVTFVRLTAAARIARGES